MVETSQKMAAIITISGDLSVTNTIQDIYTRENAETMQKESPPKTKVYGGR
jgi:hypothetical protein